MLVKMEGVLFTGEKKKKRGRKPKNKTIVNATADFNVNPQEDNLIVSIKKKKDKSTEEKAFPGFEENTFSEIQSDKSVSCCWNCSYDISREINFPLRYIDGTFYVYGSFCTFECAGRYLIETYHNRDMWDKYVLLNYYYNEINQTDNKHVYPAPDKRILKKFGGTMTIEEYRSESSRNIGYITLPPVFPVNHTIHTNDYKGKPIDVNTDLKLYRKKTTQKKQDIYSTMNIQEQV